MDNIFINQNEFVEKMYYKNNPVLCISGKLNSEDQLVMQTFLSLETFTTKYLIEALSYAVVMLAEGKNMDKEYILNEMKRILSIDDFKPL